MMHKLVSALLLAAGNGKLEFNGYVKLAETLAPNAPAGKGGKP